MNIDRNPTLRISIWRDFSPQRPIALFSDSHGDTTPASSISADLDLQEEIYSWHLLEDPFAGISDEQIRRDLGERLHQLDASRPPSDRRLAVLEDFVAAARRVIDAGHAQPVPSQVPSIDQDDQPNPISALLALSLHLKWLTRCFADHPGISVSVR